MSTAGQRALGVAAGLLLDRALGEPPERWHPVAWFGTAMGGVEKVLYRDSRATGVVHAVVGATLGAASGAGLVVVTGAVHGLAAGASRSCGHAGRGNGDGSCVTVTQGRAAQHGAALHGAALHGAALHGAAPVALAVGVASAGRMLRRTSRTIEDHLLRRDLEAARAALPSLVGRDASGLDGSGVAAAVVESLAENTVDAVLAPAFWGLAAGAPGVLVHRAVNTMDAMVGHRSPRYARFGTAAARLDDAMAWLPARLFAAVVGMVAPSRAGEVARLVRRDAPAHPSPSSGVAETAVAAALGVELGGPLRYGDQVEDRPRLGDGPRPAAVDIAGARQLVDRVELTVVALCLAAWWADRAAARHTRRRDA